MSAPLVAFSTVASAEQGERLARALVERGLAACVNVLGGATSYYLWQGALQRDDECLLIIKTSAARFEELRQALVELKATRRLVRPVALAEIKARGDFAESPLVRQGRLSVVPLGAAQWKALLAMGGQ